MTTLTRRCFITGAIAATSALRSGAINALPANRFPRDPRKRIAVATYPFRRSILAPENDQRDATKPGMDLIAFARFVKREFQVDGIEPLHAHFSSTTPDELIKLRAQLDDIGVFVANIPVDAPVDLCSLDSATRGASNSTYRKWIDIAKLLRSPSIRVWIPRCSDLSNIARAAAALMPSVGYAGSQGIVINLENDDPVFDSVTRVVKVIRQANTPYLRGLPDFGNGLMGGEEASNSAGVIKMFSCAWNIAHVKDAEDVKGQRRTVSLRQLFGIAKAADYRGYYSMESDSSVDPVLDTRHLIHESLQLI